MQTPMTQNQTTIPLLILVINVYIYMHPFVQWREHIQVDYTCKGLKEEGLLSAAHGRISTSGPLAASCKFTLW